MTAVRFPSQWRRSLARGTAMLLPVWLACLALPASAQELLLDAAADASLYEEAADGANGAGPGLFTGRTDFDLRRRALLRFDLSALPAGASITSAELVLTMDRTIAGPVPVALHRVLASWGEGSSTGSGPGGGIAGSAGPGDATWQWRLLGESAWTTPGGDIAAQPSASTVVGVAGSYAWSGPGLVADLQAWQANPASNAGWLLLADESLPPPTAKRFVSREGATPSQRPLLRIGYSLASAPPPVPQAQVIPMGGTRVLVLLSVLVALVGARALRRA